MSDFTHSEMLAAYAAARKSRKSKYEVYLFDQNREERLLTMLHQMNAGTYVHGGYRELVLHDSKKRYVASPGFPDHIIHHLAYARLYPMLDPKMTHTTFACRAGYGTHKAIKCLRRLLSRAEVRFGDDAYYCKIDFSKYFFTIHHDLLKAKIRKFCRDDRLFWAIGCIIDSYISPPRFDSIFRDCTYYVGEPRKGVPIGGILSQLFANFFLNDFDQLLKHELKIRSVRYMDDVIMIADKRSICEALDRVRRFCLDERLVLREEKIKVHPISDGVRFCGYQVRDGRIQAGKRICVSFQRFMDRLEGILGWDAGKKALTRDDILRLRSMYGARMGCFRITSSGYSYPLVRGDIEYIRGGNANNGPNDGVFTLNLNGNAGNTNRNVGFRCSQ